MRYHVVGGLCLLNGYRTGVELGVNNGIFCLNLCGMTPDMRMLAVDLWQDKAKSDVECDENYHNAEAVYQEFKANVEKHYPEQIMVMRKDTVEAANYVQDGTVDFVFIDADHTYEGAKRDIAAWLPKVRPGGMICGHDYNDKWPTVKQAVQENFPQFAIFKDSVWVRFIPIRND